LKLVASLRATSNDWGYIELNASASNFTNRTIFNNSGTVSSRNGTSPANWTYFVVGNDTYTASTFGSLEIYLPNYASANYKSISMDSVQENNSATNMQELGAGLWSNTAAITQVTFKSGYGNYKEFSSVTLYGIKSS
jgi:hypothetical protein